MRALARRVIHAGCALVAVVAVVATAVAGPATSASAANTWTFTDDMEVHGTSDPSSRFSFESADGYQLGHIRDDAPTTTLPVKAHSGSHYAEVDAGYGTDWSSVERLVTIGPVARGFRSSCRFSAWTYSGYEDFNIEVIEPGTYRYLAVARVHHGDWQYQKMSSPSFTPNISTVMLRVSFLGPNLPYSIVSHIDDFELTCTF